MKRNQGGNRILQNNKIKKIRKSIHPKKSLPSPKKISQMKPESPVVKRPGIIDSDRPSVMVAYVSGYSSPDKRGFGLKEYEKWALTFIRPCLAHMIPEAKAFMGTHRSEQEILRLISKNANRQDPKTMALALDAINLGLRSIRSDVFEEPISIYSIEVLVPATAYSLHRLSWMAAGDEKIIHMLAKLFSSRLTGSQGMVEQVADLIRLSEGPLSTRSSRLQRQMASEVFPSVGCTEDAKNLAFEALARKKRLTKSGILIHRFDITLNEEDVLTLLPGRSPSNKIINFYLQMVQFRSQQFFKHHSVFAFPAEFYPLLAKRGYQGVQRNVNIFDKHSVLIPVCTSNHWSLCWLDLCNRGIDYYDSKGGQANSVLETVHHYLSKLWLQTHNEDVPFTVIHKQKCNKQTSEKDSAVFMCKYAEYLASSDVGLTSRPISDISAITIDYFRYQMMYEILTGSLVQNHK